MVLVINYDKKAFRGLRLFLYPISLTSEIAISREKMQEEVIENIF